MAAPSSDRAFQDWSRVIDHHGRSGVIVWDPGEGAYKVLWDDNGWEDYSAQSARVELTPE